MNVLLHAAVETARISLPTIREARRGGLSQAVCDQRLRSWAQTLIQRADIQLSVEGLSHLEPRSSPFVVVSNHESYYDIPCLYATLPLSLRMAAKKELFQIPIWGPALRASGFVEINRQSPKAAYQALREAGQFMAREGVSLYIAPEGTRSEAGLLGRFKKGAFEVARVAGFRVLPVVLRGTGAVHKKGELRVHRGRRVVVSVLPPLSPSAFPGSKEMAEATRAQIEEALKLP